MKIALVYFQLTTQAGGQQQVYHLARELMHQGHSVTIYTAEIDLTIYPSLLEGLNVKVVPPAYPFGPLLKFDGDGLLARISKKRKLDWLFTDTARRIASAMDDDFHTVNCHEDFAYKTGYFYKKRNPSARVVWTMNNPAYMRFPKETLLLRIANFLYVAYHDLVEKKYFRAVDMTCVLSVYEEKWAEDRRLPVRIVWSGVDFERFYAPVKQWTKKMPLAVMGLGALNAVRRYEDIIEAVGIARKAGYDVVAKIVCKDIWDEKAYRGSLVELVGRLGLKPYVSMNFDGLNESELKEAYRASDVFVLPVHIPPPQGYGWGAVAFEAASAGLPLVLSNKTGAAHVLTNDENALMVDPKRPDQIARQLMRLMDDPDLYKHIAEGGQRFTKDNISWQKYTDRMVTLFRPDFCRKHYWGTDVDRPCTKCRFGGEIRLSPDRHLDTP